MFVESFIGRNMACFFKKVISFRELMGKDLKAIIWEIWDEIGGNFMIKFLGFLLSLVQDRLFIKSKINKIKQIKTQTKKKL